MRRVVWIALGALLSTPAVAGTWSSLWRTPDQQGQALLAAGHPAEAADHFADPRLKAYADLEAYRYAQAARLLAPFKDATSEYNRGNALAHTGHLHQALAAYDAALKQAPGNKDIRHNRELVARMLKRHPPKSPTHGGGHGPRRNQARAQGSGQGQSQSAGGRSQSKSGQTAGHHPGGGTQGGKSPSGGRHSSQSAGAGRNGDASAGQRSGPGAAARRGGSGSGAAQQPGQEGTAAAPRPTTGSGSAKRSPGQARRDAALAAAIARGKKHPRSKATSGAAAAKLPAARHGSPLSGGGTRTPKPTPPSEKTLALDQWLRQIPDNPAGLLRRKFLIEYMMKHPGRSQ